MSLLTVTGEPLGGGDKEISLGLTFGVVGGGQWKTNGVFHAADIHVDAILSYPWLKEQRLAVCPGSGCLALETSENAWTRVTDYGGHPVPVNDYVPGLSDDDDDDDDGDGTYMDAIQDRIRKISQCAQVIPYALPEEPGVKPLTMREKRFVQRVLVGPRERLVRSIVEAKSPIEAPGLTETKDALYRDY